MPNPALPNMGLILPTENSDAGEWDTYANDAFELVDSHDHTTGRGVQIPTAGIRINADLTMTNGGTSYAMKDTRAVDFSPTAASAMSAYAGALFVNSSDSNNLYFRTQAGANVRITNGSQLDFTVAGGIGGDYVAAGAAVAYTSASDTYTFKKPTPGNWARLQAGALRISEYNTTETTYVELACPASLGGNYTITPATALPSGEQPVCISSTGQLIYGHGDRTLNVTVQAGFGNSAGTTNPSGTTYAVSGGAGTDWFLPLALRVGDRVKSITWYYKRGAGTHTFAFRATTLATGVDADVGTPASTSSGTTYTNITQSSINKTLVSTEAYYLRWSFSATDAGNLLHAVQVVYDRP